MGNKGYLFNENVVEWMKGQDRVTVSFTQGKYVNRIKKLAEKHPEECDVVVNNDGSICGHIPLSYLKISRPREMSEEQKMAAADRLKGIREKN